MNKLFKDLGLSTTVLKSIDKQLQKSLNKDRRAGGFVVSVSKS